MSDPAQTIAFQGAPGAYSDLACRRVFPAMTTLPCAGFDDAMAAVHDGEAALAMLPVENSVAGRVADIHHLLPDSGLHIIGEHFSRVEHHLLAVPGATIADLKTVRSHVHALSQCRKLIRELDLKAVVAADTAGSAAEVARAGDKSVASIASALAGQIYGLVSLRQNIEDAEHNTTRFLVMAREAANDGSLAVTSFVFNVRNVPAALYKALGGFATNGINMTKLESYMVGGHFTATQFYADVEGHPEDRSRPPALCRPQRQCLARPRPLQGRCAGDVWRSRLRTGLPGPPKHARAARRLPALAVAVQHFRLAGMGRWDRLPLGPRARLLRLELLSRSGVARPRLCGQRDLQPGAPARQHRRDAARALKARLSRETAPERGPRRGRGAARPNASTRRRGCRRHPSPGPFRQRPGRRRDKRAPAPARRRRGSAGHHRGSSAPQRRSGSRTRHAPPP